MMSSTFLRRTLPAAALASTLLTVGCGVDARASLEAAAEAAAGRDLYVASCASCHGFDAKGLPGLGSDLRARAAMETMAHLVEMTRDGRPADHPSNTSGMEMPPRGGNPSLTDQDLYDIAAYLQPPR